MKVYIDCSETFLTASNTGVHRVVRNIVKYKEQISESTGAEVVPVIAKGDRFYPLDLLSERSVRHQAIRSILLKSSRSAYIKLQSLWKKHITPLTGGKGKISTFEGGVRKLVRKGAYRFLFQYATLSLKKNAVPVTINSEDILFMADAFWGSVYPIIAAENARRDGTMVVSIIYDLIPIYYSEFCNPAFVHVFRDALPRVIRYSDCILCISKSAESEIRQWLNQYMPEYNNVKSAYFYCGSDIGASAPNVKSSVIRKEISELVKRDDIFLMVGSLEPRKGHSDVVTAFDWLWKNGFSGRLVIVGAIALGVDDLMVRMRAHAELGKRLFLYHNVNDYELGLLYKKSKSLIFSSYVEGFGLPLVEALSVGTPVIARDIGIFREIGGSLPTYFDSIEELIECIRRTPARHDREAIGGAGLEALKSWEDSVRDIGKILHGWRCTERKIQAKEQVIQ